jgi:hypothetical protein
MILTILKFESVKKLWKNGKNRKTIKRDGNRNRKTIKENYKN